MIKEDFRNHKYLGTHFTSGDPRVEECRVRDNYVGLATHPENVVTNILSEGNGCSLIEFYEKIEGIDEPDFLNYGFLGVSYTSGDPRVQESRVRKDFEALATHPENVVSRIVECKDGESSIEFYEKPETSLEGKQIADSPFVWHSVMKFEIPESERTKSFDELIEKYGPPGGLADGKVFVKESSSEPEEESSGDWFRRIMSTE